MSECQLWCDAVHSVPLSVYECIRVQVCWCSPLCVGVHHCVLVCLHVSSPGSLFDSLSLLIVLTNTDHHYKYMNFMCTESIFKICKYL